MRTKEINKAFEALRGIFYSANVNHADKLFDLCRAEEKGHRNWGPEFAKYHPGAPSLNDMARMFAVKRVAEYLSGEEYPSGDDYLHMQHSCFYAAGIAEEFGNQICVVWAEFGLSELAALDYTDYVKAQVPADTKERIAQ